MGRQPFPDWEIGPLTREKFIALGERFHHKAEDNLVLHGHVAPFCFLFGPNAEALSAVGGVQQVEEMLDVLYAIAKEQGAVAAILIRQAATTEYLPGELLGTAEGHRLAMGMPKTHISIVTESRWPAGGVRQMRITAVRHTSFGGVTLTRDPCDPDQARRGTDDLAQILPHVSTV